MLIETEKRKKGKKEGRKEGRKKRKERRKRGSGSETLKTFPRDTVFNWQDLYSFTGIHT